MLVLNGSEQKIVKHASSSKLFLEDAGYVGIILKIRKDVFLYFCKDLFFPLLFSILFPWNEKKFSISLSFNLVKKWKLNVPKEWCIPEIKNWIWEEFGTL